MHPLIRLENISVFDLLPDLEDESFDLVIFDNPWSQYKSKPGKMDPSGVYPVLSVEDIGQVMETCVQKLRPGRRAVSWMCWPLLVEAVGALSRGSRVPWLDVPGLRWVSGGSWHKEASAPGGGFHWRGHSEPLFLGVKGTGVGRPAKVQTLEGERLLRNAFSSPRLGHSEKPEEWQKQMIQAFVPEGGKILDPFAGRGSVARATLAAGGGRRYVGCEIDTTRWAKAWRGILERT